MFEAVSTLGELRAALAALPPPVIAFNKSHSGSRVVASLLRESGLFIGSELNDSLDAVAMLPMLETLVERFHPDYSRLWQGEVDPALVRVLAEGFARHLARWAGGPWGWKLCETVYILPVLDYLFPAARYVHTIRDGRDVALSNHVPPKSRFWQKVYVNTDGVGRWQGLFLGRHSRTGYRLMAPIYNLQHWTNSVTLGRRQGMMLRERYLEVRYEALCSQFAVEARRLLDFAGLTPDDRVIEHLGAKVRSDRIEKYRRASPLLVRRLERRARPLLIELGYLPGRGD